MVRTTNPEMLTAAAKSATVAAMAIEDAVKTAGDKYAALLAADEAHRAAKEAHLVAARANRKAVALMAQHEKSADRHSAVACEMRVRAAALIPASPAASVPAPSPVRTASKPARKSTVKRHSHQSGYTNGQWEQGEDD